MHYIIYQITNTVNGKIYIGKHQTTDVNDSYMGSGKLLKAAINKYGLAAFKKEILHVFESEVEMNTTEKELVTEEFCLRHDTYNLCVGGKGGFSYINSTPDLVAKRDKTEHKLAGRAATNKIIIEQYGSLSAFNRIVGKLGAAKFKEKYHTDDEFRHRMQDHARQGRENAASQEACEKRKNTMRERGHSKGELNSQFGTVWVTNGIENKKIKKTDVIPEGWYKGRKITVAR